MDESKLMRLGMRAAHAIVNQEPFLADLAEGLRRVVGADCVCIDQCREWPRQSPSVTLAGEPGAVPAAVIDKWMRLAADDDPYVAYVMATRDPRPYRTSDFMAFSRFRETSLYREVLAGYEMRHLLLMTPRVASDDLVLIGLTRRLHDFTDAETAALRPVRDLIASALDYRRLVGAVEAGIHAAAPPADPRRLTLTQREDQVLALVAAGHTNDQAAKRLGISARTVRKHLESVFSKVNVPSRAAAVAWWLGRRTHR